MGGVSPGATEAPAQEVALCKAERPPGLVMPVASDSLISLVPKERKVKNLISVFPALLTAQVSVVVRLTQHCGSPARMCV